MRITRNAHHQEINTTSADKMDEETESAFCTRVNEIAEKMYEMINRVNREWHRPCSAADHITGVPWKVWALLPEELREELDIDEYDDNEDTLALFVAELPKETTFEEAMQAYCKEHPCDCGICEIWADTPEFSHGIQSMLKASTDAADVLKTMRNKERKSEVYVVKNAPTNDDEKEVKSD